MTAGAGRILAPGQMGSGKEIPPCPSSARLPLPLS